jgi:hypothetical protein
MNKLSYNFIGEEGECGNFHDVVRRFFRDYVISPPSNSIRSSSSPTPPPLPPAIADNVDCYSNNRDLEIKLEEKSREMLERAGRLRENLNRLIIKAEVRQIALRQRRGVFGI